MNIIGKMLENRYEIIEKIGIGGMATVYRAKCHLLNREVAVKVLKDEYTTDSEFIKRFNAEAQSAASLTHPNIVSVYDVGQVDDMYYIVMELIKGSTLKEIISEEGRISWKWSLNIAKQIASALEVAHKNAIVHRDIKPHNIIITEDGVAKVTDFGIAKAVTNATMTSYGNTLGSVHYFSPEHAKGTLTDAKSDIYSLGIVMYEMVTGKVPFDADTPVSVALKQVQEKPIEPISINTEIPEGLNYIILKAMEKDKSLRYDSVREMLEDINILIKNPDADLKSSNETLKKQITTVIPNVKEKMKEKNIFEKYEWLKPVIAVLAVIVIILFSMLITVSVLKKSRGQEAFIPNLAGEFEEKRKTKEEAEEELKKLGFEYEIIEENHDDIEKGQVIKQDPKFQPNYKIKTNSKIKLYVSKGPEVIKIPEIIKTKENYKDKKIEDIIKELENAGLKYEEKEEFSEEIEAGKIIEIKFEAENDEIKKKNKVMIIKSKGTSRKEVVVPNVEGKSAKEALEELEKLGLVVQKEESYVEYLSNGVATATEPRNGTKLREKDKIILFINKLPELKKGKIIVDIKKLAEISDEEESMPGTVNIRVTSDDEQIEDKKFPKSTKEITLDISSLGRSRIKVYVNGSQRYDDYIDLNQKTVWNITK